MADEERDRQTVAAAWRQVGESAQFKRARAGVIMSNDGEAGVRSRKGSAKRQSGKPTDGGSQSGAKKRRVQYHLAEQVVSRLGVHCSMVHRNESAMVEEILLKWLRQYGKGRSLFDEISEAGQSDDLPDNGEDRQDATAA